MLTNIKNAIYLWLWKSQRVKKTTEGRIKIKRSFESFYSVVYDITWSITLLDKEGNATAKHTISERTDRRNVITTIRSVENTKLPSAIRSMQERQQRNDREHPTQ